MDIKLLLAKIAQKLRRDGCLTTCRDWLKQLRRKHADDDFDTRNGTDTGGNVPLWNFHISSPNRLYGKSYEATKERDLVDAINFLQEDPRDLTFIDLGCGKGKALLVAAKFGFRQSIGVEFVHELAGIAKANLARKRIHNAVVVEADAAEYRFPDTDLVVYLYNPFRQEVVLKVVANLKECCSKKLYVVYNSPLYASILEASGFLTPFGRVPGRSDILVWTTMNRGLNTGDPEKQEGESIGTGLPPRTGR